MIEGIQIIPIKTHEDERGFFREIVRFPEQFTNHSVGQLSHSMVREGVIKGWHGHVYQSQWNYILMGEAKVALKDDRVNSPSYGKIQTFEAGDSNHLGYFFPPGVLHAYHCYVGPMHIIYATSGIYNPDNEVKFPIIEQIWE